MKGVFSSRRQIPRGIGANGYAVLSPHFWIEKDSQPHFQEHADGSDGRHYCILVQGDADRHVVDAVKRYLSGYGAALRSLTGRWLILAYGESPHGAHPRLCLLSDRIGSRWIYYAYDERLFTFSTNLGDLLTLKRGKGQGLQLDAAGLAGYLHFLHLPAPRTLVRGVSVLPPASSLTLSEEGVKVERYWAPEFSPAIGSKKEAVAEIKGLLRDVVEARIAGFEGKTGLLLSGGLDSSLLAALGAQAGKDLTAYTVGFEEASDERDAAQAVARHFRIDHREILLRPEDVPGLLWEVTRCLGFPTGNPSSLATFAIAREACKEERRLLSGIGSDELFGGHRKHVLARYWPCAHRLLSLARGGWHPFNGAHTQDLTGRPARIDRYLDLYTFFDDRQLERLLLPGYWPTENGFYADLSREDFLQEQFMTDIYAWLAGGLLPMATALTGRYGLMLDLPFCDDRVMAYAARLPLRLKVRGLEGKWALRRAVRDLVPEWVLTHRRQGFTLPMGQWLRGPLKGLLDTFLCRQVVECRKLFNPEAIERMAGAHCAGRMDLSLQLWGLITLEVWQRIFLDPQR